MCNSGRNAAAGTEQGKMGHQDHQQNAQDDGHARDRQRQGFRQRQNDQAGRMGSGTSDLDDLPKFDITLPRHGHHVLEHAGRPHGSVARQWSALIPAIHIRRGCVRFERFRRGCEEIELRGNLSTPATIEPGHRRCHRRAMQQDR
jgi:hypothetical protein